MTIPITQIIYYGVAAVIIIVGTVATLIARFAKSETKRKNAEVLAESCTEHLKLLAVIKEAMIDTEDKKNFTAVEKHEYCKAKIIDKCINSDIDYTQFDLDEEIANNMEIANNINSTKRVNENNGG